MNIIKYMQIIVFSTYGYSLETWHISGTLKRELDLYKKIYEKNYYSINVFYCFDLMLKQ